MHFAEFGVVLMLFLIGLELEPANFWRMRNLIIGTGAIQLGVTTVLVFGIFLCRRIRLEGSYSPAAWLWLCPPLQLSCRPCGKKG